ncbi:MAG: type II CRISPR RNA-guided endonuclease Cas9 [Prevotella sp.]|nr:type II CRISPR RNA-guided endonuclease Cas9 [Prevotella sp.]
MKNILGLDLGTNSIGWALIDGEEQKIIKAGSRIIPMDAATLGDFQKGNLQSQAAARTGFRGTRRLYERAKLRRERLLRVLNILNFLPDHFKSEIDFSDHPGQFINHAEPLLPYRQTPNGKREFIFMDSFNEMIADFQREQPDLVSDGKKIPYDWTIYYLRQKALTKPIKREELAWIILNFNTKRGYYQLRGMEDETATKDNEEYKILKVVNVEKMDEDKKRKGMYWYEITYENGAKQRRLSITPPRNIGDMVEVIVTTTYDKDGNIKLDKEGDPKISISTPKPDEWQLLKKKSENAIRESGKTVGQYIYSELLNDPNTKVRGKLIRVIDRKFYKDELERIIRTQTDFIPELNDNILYEKCINELYHNNSSHIQSIATKDFTRLFLDDIIFYQRPLKSKKSEIADCPYEMYEFINKETGEVIRKPIKCIPKSNPLYQEFRLWQFVRNIRIFEKEKVISGVTKRDVDVTNDFLSTEEDVCNLFEWLNEKKEISQKDFLKYKPFNLGKNTNKYRWNYSEEKSYPCNETHYEIMKRMTDINPSLSLSKLQETALWHILYSVTDVIEMNKALRSYASKNNINPEAFVEAFSHIKPFLNDYGAYSEKAIKKLLPLMRTGRYWKVEDIDNHTLNRINNIINGIADDSISTQTREKAKELEDISQFKYLPIWLACYVVYDRHSEASNTSRWQTPADIDRYLREEFKQHSLRNPVVEMVLGEMIRVVRDIWSTYGEISEVHVELGRDLKKNNLERARSTKTILDNERRNYRIRQLLQEFANPEYNIEGVRPHSPSQQEILKIFEEDALAHITADDDNIQQIANDLGNSSKHVSKSDIMRYRLWLEQRYKSPYSGQTIPLSKLFTPAYEIEHIIPQSRYFDDSLSNKVICESELNKLKDRMLGYEFITKHGGEIIPGNFGGEIPILDVEQYKEFIKLHYSDNKTKARKLLMDDIPEEFIERQLNDSRYIARKTIEILSHLVREKDEHEATSKNVISTNGSITDRLKKEWGINDIWNDIIAPRFQRLNRITGTENYGKWIEKDGKRYFQINVPLEISQGFNKKRIDHRHHAMDAIVIAATTRDHINYLNNQAALDPSGKMRYDLQRKLCTKVKTDEMGNYVWRFNKPWNTFTQDVRDQLFSIIVSFKQNLRVINKMTNFYWHYENSKKVLSRQTKGDGLAIRKSLHKAFYYGAVRIQSKKSVKLAEALDDWHNIADKEIRQNIKMLIGEYHKFDKKTFLKYFKDRDFKIGQKDIRKVDVYYTPDVAEHSTRRVSLDETFDKSKIESITDTGIQKILFRHLEMNNNDPKIAFTPEGIAEMNKNIKTLNGGKDHKPILKVRKFETLGQKFPVGESGSKTKKYVESDKGTNLFYAVYVNEKGKRTFVSIPLEEAIERLKNNQKVADEQLDDNKLLFILSPLDLVYVPENEDDDNGANIDINKIWKVVSFFGNRSCFIPESISNCIVSKTEFGTLDKVELTDEKISIKNVCIKIEVNRLGIITKIHDSI